MKMFIFKGVCLSVLLVLTLSCTKTQEQEEKPWDWSLDDVKATVGKVRAGQDLTPESWPNGAKVAVALSFDFDAETNALRDMILSPGLFSQGEYAARVAIRRI
ncbi:MAG: polysaccharide deacetylase, partial [Candidatus Aminicenantes bacterium]|nr:polysaccharide deacetylase [Candidatus Aminicenantes bacterium]